MYCALTSRWLESQKSSAAFNLNVTALDAVRRCISEKSQLLLHTYLLHNSNIFSLFFLAEEMDQADSELRETITNIWPLQAKKMLDLLVPPNDQLNKGKMTVGKVYAGLCLYDAFRVRREGGQTQGGMGVCSHDRNSFFLII